MNAHQVRQRFLAPWGRHRDRRRGIVDAASARVHHLVPVQSTSYLYYGTQPENFLHTIIDTARLVRGERAVQVSSVQLSSVRLL